MTRDRGAADSSLTGVTALWSLSKTHLLIFTSGKDQNMEKTLKHQRRLGLFVFLVSSDCLCDSSKILAVPYAFLQFVIFPDPAHLLFKTHLEQFCFFYICAINVQCNYPSLNYGHFTHKTKGLGINTSNCLLWELIGPSGVLERYLTQLEIAKMHSGPMDHWPGLC